MSDPDRAGDVERLRELAERATPGPWVVQVEGGIDHDGEGWSQIEIDFAGGPEIVPGVHPGLMMGTHEGDKDDAEFIAAARNLLPALLDERDALVAERDALQRAVDAAQIAAETTARRIPSPYADNVVGAVRNAIARALAAAGAPQEETHEPR